MVLEFLIFSIKNSIESVAPIGIKIFLKIHIFDRSSLVTSSSSFLVPDFVTSIEGKTLLSESFLSKIISEFPVPLNYSKITSSILDPVSTSAVPIIVKEPPSSIFLAAPKNLFGLWSALASTPPVKTFPELGT